MNAQPLAQPDSNWKRLYEYPDLIFDLDGTLINSRASITKCWTMALADVGIHTGIPLDDRLFSISAHKASQILASGHTNFSAQHLLNHFSRHYDTWGWKQSMPFDGVEHHLNALKNAGAMVHLVTNKRRVPTDLILRHLGWSGYFRSIYCPDDTPNSLRSKPSMIKDLLDAMRIPMGQAAYVGDTEDDESAAQSCGVAFIAATWGDAHRYYAPTMTGTKP